jgi:hypothetical protein
LLKEVSKSIKREGVFMSRQKPTDTGDLRHIVAINAMIEGKTVTEAAALANMSRENLSRLRHHNPVFIAELNRRRADAQGATLDGLRVLIERITAAVLAALNNPETPPSVILQSGLSALPKLYAITGELSKEPTEEQTIAMKMIPDSVAAMLYERENMEAARIVEEARREIEAVAE